jgi:hypothetical protein
MVVMHNQPTTIQPLPRGQRILRRRPDAPMGPFSVTESALANEADLSDITDVEIDAFARLIIDCYNEWKKQSHTSEYQTSDKPTTVVL